MPLTSTTTTYPNLLKNLQLKKLLLCYKMQLFYLKFQQKFVPSLEASGEIWVKTQHIVFDKPDMVGLNCFHWLFGHVGRKPPFKPVSCDPTLR